MGVVAHSGYFRLMTDNHCCYLLQGQSHSTEIEEKIEVLFAGRSGRSLCFLDHSNCQLSMLCTIEARKMN